MKKAIALITAAVAIFAAAGCANKQPDQAATTESAADTRVGEPATESSPQPETMAEESAAEESTAPAPSSTVVVVVTGGKEFGIQQPDETSVVELVPTIAPPKPRPSITERTTKPATTRPAVTPPEQVSMAKPEHDPELVYPDSFSVTENGATDSLSVVSHSCELFEHSTGEYTFRITVRFDVTEYSGTRSGMNVAYNCYDKDGALLNNKPLSCYVPLSGADKTVQGYVSAIGNTVRIELINYY